MTREFPKNNPPKITPPTVGRVVLIKRQGAPDLAAIVAFVHEGGYTINAGVFNEDGSVGGLSCVLHASDADEAGNAYPRWDWMDFQKGQAAKTEELEAKLKNQTYADRFGKTFTGTIAETEAGTSQGNEGKS